MHVPSSHLNSSAVHSLGGGLVGAAVHIQTPQFGCTYTHNKKSLYYKMSKSLSKSMHESKAILEYSTTYGSQTRQCRQHNDIQSSHSAETMEYTSHHHT